MDRNITTEDRALLDWIDQNADNESVQRRAQIILLNADEMPTTEIAEKVELSEGQVRHWIRLFNTDGFGIFPEDVLNRYPGELPDVQELEQEPEWISMTDLASPDSQSPDSSSEPEEMELDEVEAEIPQAVETQDPETTHDFTIVEEPERTEEVPAESPIEGEDIPDTEVEPRVLIDMPSLLEQYQIDTAHSSYVATKVGVLFTQLKEFHELKEDRLRLLEITAQLLDVGYVAHPDDHPRFGRDLCQEYEIEGVDEEEQRIAALAIVLHEQDVKPKRIQKELEACQISGTQKSDALAIAALLRVADGLDTSRTQTTEVLEVSRNPSGFIAIQVDGPMSEQDAQGANSRADLWTYHFGFPLTFHVGDLLENELGVPEVIPEKISLPKKLKAPGIQSDDLMSEAGRKVLLYHYLRMREHEPGTLAGEDIEELHDMRVATRRMRSTLRVFQPYFQKKAIKPILKGLRATGRALGPVRDLDVFMENANQYVAELVEDDRQALNPLIEDWAKERELARSEMFEYLTSPAYQRFLDDFEQFLATEGAGARQYDEESTQPRRVHQLVPTLIYQRYETLRGYEDIIETAPLETLHALRIDVKRFRYSLEFFQEVLGPESETVIKESVRLQDHLGELHDADVACQILIEYLDHWRSSMDRERTNIRGVTQYLIAQQSILRSLVTTFPEKWHAFNREDVRRNLAMAIAAL